MLLKIEPGGRRRGHAEAPAWTPEEEAFFELFLWATTKAGIGPWRLTQLFRASSATTHAWFRRRSLPGGRHMIRLPEILRVNGHWLLTGKGRP